jgi:co-chaperonin GroES (HSP10)
LKIDPGTRKPRVGDPKSPEGKMKKKEVKFKTIKKRIIVKAFPDEEMSAGGIILSARAKEEVLKKATVVAIGSKIENVKKKDVIFFRTMAMKTMEVDGQKYHDVQENSVLAIEDTSNKKLGVRVIKNRVIVEEIKASEELKSGLIIPGGRMDKEDVRKGRIVAAGEKAIVKVGDIVLFNHDAGVKIDLKCNSYLVLGDDHLYGIIAGKKDVNVA